MVKFGEGSGIELSNEEKKRLIQEKIDSLKTDIADWRDKQKNSVKENIISANLIEGNVNRGEATEEQAESDLTEIDNMAETGHGYYEDKIQKALEDINKLEKEKKDLTG